MEVNHFRRWFSDIFRQRGILNQYPVEITRIRVCVPSCPQSLRVVIRILVISSFDHFSESQIFDSHLPIRNQETLCKCILFNLLTI
jgi:hypothetical protein